MLYALSISIHILPTEIRRHSKSVLTVKSPVTWTVTPSRWKLIPTRNDVPSDTLRSRRECPPRTTRTTTKRFAHAVSIVHIFVTQSLLMRVCNGPVQSRACTSATLKMTDGESLSFFTTTTTNNGRTRS